MKRLYAWLFVGLLAAAPAVGCSDSDAAAPKPPPPCNEDPWSCADGQTCWANAAGDKFDCITAGQGQVGDMCQSVVGQTTCADDLACLQLSGQQQGTCRPYCDLQDPAHACPIAGTCIQVTLSTPAGNMFTIHLCAPEGGGGMGGAGGTGGAGGGAGSTGGAGGAGGGP